MRDTLFAASNRGFALVNSFSGSYTWRRSVDTSGAWVSDKYLNSIGSPLCFHPRLNRGLSDLNVAQNLEIDYTWGPETPRWNFGAMDWALS